LAQRRVAPVHGSRERRRCKSGARCNHRLAPALWRLLAPSAGFEWRVAVAPWLLKASASRRGVNAPLLDFHGDKSLEAASAPASGRWSPAAANARFAVSMQ